MRPPAAILLATLLATACGGDPAPVPRRHAYPRLPQCDSSFARVPGAALPFEANTSATARTDSAGRWLTISYPLYDADIYITFTPADSPAALQQALDNRRERMSLNLAGAPATTVHITSADSSFDAALVEAPDTGTPLQFVATDGERWAVSGAVRLNTAAGAPYDSIRPVVDVLRRDIVHALNLLTSRP